MAAQKPQIRESALVVANGQSEFTFCKYLKAQLCSRQNKVCIENGYDGDVQAILRFARRLLRQSQYSRVAFVLSNASLDATSLRSVNSVKGELIIFQPCIESFFLKVLNETHSDNVVECRDQFNAKFNIGEGQLDSDICGQILPKHLFEKWSSHAEFNQLQRLFNWEHREAA